MQMDTGLDTGAVLLKSTCAIHSNDTSETLHDRLATLGATTLLETLAKLPTLNASPQHAADVTWAPKISKQDAKIDWQKPANVIDAMIRAFLPWPVAYTELDDTRVRLWKAHVVPSATTHPPGTILSANPLTVATGKDALVIEALQFPGGKCVSPRDVLNANPGLFTGKHFHD